MKHVSSIAAYVFTVARNEATRFAHRKRREPSAGGVLRADALFAELGSDEPPVPKSVSPWNELVVPGIDAARQAADRCRANMRCLRVLNAVTRLEQRGVAVTGLADLGLSEEETTDPFTGQPPLIKRLPDGWVIYSVGKDLKDDGGNVDDLTDFGLGPVPPLPSIE